MNIASLVWATPNAEELLAKIARVSNPANQENPSFEGLIKYMIKHHHWSPFEMVSAVVEINTTRDIGRQILRHRSFSFQEFSQRYADATLLPPIGLRECRMQDTKNRQSSIPTNDAALSRDWEYDQRLLYDMAEALYKDALAKGIAKEQARALLPEGLTPTRMYMAGTLRSWLHYLQLRTGPETQKEHRQVAQSIFLALEPSFPVTFPAVFNGNQ